MPVITMKMLPKMMIHVLVLLVAMNGVKVMKVVLLNLIVPMSVVVPVMTMIAAFAMMIP